MAATAVIPYLLTGPVSPPRAASGRSGYPGRSSESGPAQHTHETRCAANRLIPRAVLTHLSGGSLAVPSCDRDCETVAMNKSVGLAVIGVLISAGSLAASPVANADIGIECHPGCWGAIAVSLSTGQEAIRQNY